MKEEAPTGEGVSPFIVLDDAPGTLRLESIVLKENWIRSMGARNLWESLKSAGGSARIALLLLVILALLIRGSIIKPWTAKIGSLLIFCLVILLLWSLFWSSSSRTNLLLTIVSGFLPLLAYEIALLQRFRPGWDSRNYADVVRDYERQGQEAIFPFYPGLLLARQDTKLPRAFRNANVLPLTGKSGTITPLAIESGTWSIFKSDEHGFNNPPGLYRPGQLDFAIVGDSFVQGQSVAPDKQLTAVFRQTYPSTIAFGTGAAGSILRMALVREYAARLRPKRVLWIEIERTVQRTLDELRYPAVAAYLQGKNQRLFDRQPEIDRLVTDWYGDARKELGANRPPSWTDWLSIFMLGRVSQKLGGLLKKAKPFKGVDGYESNLPVSLTEFNTLSQRSRINLLLYHPDKPLQKYLTCVRTARREVERWGGTFVWVYLPTPNPLSKSSSAYDSYDHEFMISLLRKESVPMIDLYKPIMAHGRFASLFPPGGGHYSELGYKVVGEALAAAVRAMDQSTPTTGTTANDH